MIRILLALVIITVLFYMNPLTKMNKSNLNEKNKNAIEQKVDDIQNQVSEAKKMAQRELDEVESND